MQTLQRPRELTNEERARFAALAGKRVIAQMRDGAFRIGVLRGRAAGCSPWLIDELNGKQYCVDMAHVGQPLPTPPGHDGAWRASRAH